MPFVRGNWAGSLFLSPRFLEPFDTVITIGADKSQFCASFIRISLFERRAGIKHVFDPCPARR